MNYKSFDINTTSSVKPWGAREEQAFRDLIDTLVFDTVGGTKRLTGHIHNKLYDNSTAVALDVSTAEIAILSGSNPSFQFGTTGPLIKNTGSGQFQARTNADASYIDFGAKDFLLNSYLRFKAESTSIASIRDAGDAIYQSLKLKQLYLDDNAGGTGYLQPGTTNMYLTNEAAGAGIVLATTNANIGIGIASSISDGYNSLDIGGKIIRVRTTKTPATASATGKAGEICWDSSFLYIATSTNTWKSMPWLTFGALPTDTDEKVKASAGDTTPAYLDTKLVAGSNITLTKQNTGLNENYRIDATSALTGTGTSGKITKWTGTSSIGDSIITEGTSSISIAGSSLAITTTSTVGNSSAVGSVGEIRWDANYLYVCVSTNTWKTLPITAFGTSPTDTDEKVKITSADTTTGYLFDKLVAGTNITLTKQNTGLNENIKIDATSSLTGSGTLGYITRWDGTSSITNAEMYVASIGSNPVLTTVAMDLLIGGTGNSSALDVRTTNPYMAMFGGIGGFIGKLVFLQDSGTEIMCDLQTDAAATLYLNRRGFQASTTQFRNLDVQNGKNVTTAFFHAGFRTLLVGTDTFNMTSLAVGNLQLVGDMIRVSTARTIANSSANGNTGEICWDATNLYVCTTTNTWKSMPWLAFGSAGGGITGSGTAGKITKWATSSSIGDSIITEGTSSLSIAGSSIAITTANTVASSSATGTAGEIRWDANRLWVCTATNTWKCLSLCAYSVPNTGGGTNSFVLESPDTTNTATFGINNNGSGSITLAEGGGFTIANGGGDWRIEVGNSSAALKVRESFWVDNGGGGISLAYDGSLNVGYTTWQSDNKLSGMNEGISCAGNTFRLETNRTPATSSAAGNLGEICWNTTYIYICTATNTWKRVAIATW